MRKERNVKVNLLICLAAALLCVTLFSMRFAGGLYAGFSKTEDGSDSARVATFNVTQEGTFFKTLEIAVTPGASQSESIMIQNNSEVSVEYTLKVEKVEANLPPLTFRLEPVNGNGTSATAESHANGISITSCQLPANQTAKYALVVEWTPNSDENADLALMGMVDYITVSVTATQID